LLTYLILGVTLTSFALVAGSRILLPLIAPPEYAPAFMVILLLVPAMAFVGMYYFGGTLITAVQKTYLVGLTMTIGAIISLLLNCMLIPKMGWYGAVIAFDVTYTLVGLVLFALGRKMFPMPVEWKRIAITAALLTLFFFVFLMIKGTSLFTFVAISLMVGLVAILVLFAFRFFYADERIAIRRLVAGLR